MTRIAPLGTELRRGAALPLAVVLAAGTALVLITNSDGWLGRWGGLADQFRVYLILLTPFAVAAGAWMGARDSRSNLKELIATSSRPAWRRLAAISIPLLLSIVVGSAVGLAIPAYFVWGTATYASGAWPLTMVISVMTMFAGSITGIVVGRLISHPIVGTAAAIAVFAGAQQLLGHMPGSLRYLSPAQWKTDDFERFATHGYIGQLTFIFGLILALCAVYAAKVWQGVAVLIVSAAIASVLFGSVSGDMWLQDQRAKEAVCAGSEPQVCVTRNHAFALGSLTRGLHAAWSPILGSRGLPTTVVEPSAAKSKPGAVRLTDDATVLSDVRGDVDLDLDWRYNFFSNVLIRNCETSAVTEASDEAATAILAGGSPYRMSPEADAIYNMAKNSSAPDRNSGLRLYVSQRMQCVENPDWATK